MSENDIKKIPLRVDEWLEMHEDEVFLPDEIFKFYDWREPATKKAVYNRLRYLTVKDPPELEKAGRYYRKIDRAVEVIDWTDGNNRPPLELKFPYGVKDDSHFSFEDNIVLHEGDLIVIAGRSNQGKTTLCLNIMAENIDRYHCRYQTSEFNKAKFRDRISHFDWVNLFNEDGTPKFELIKLKQNYRYAILPDAINFLDWFTLPDKMWQIEGIMSDLKSRVKRGIIVIVLQKSRKKEYGLGGEFSEHYADLYLTIDPSKLTVKKAKSWNGDDPNYRMYGFRIIDSGSKFHDIREVKNCPSCKGYGYSFGNECSKCNGKGFVDY